MPVVEKPTVSSTFVAEANAASVSYNVGRAQQASGGAVTEASLVYEAGTESFTVNAGAENIIFGRADLAINSSNILQYKRIEGDTIAQLHLDWGLRSEWASAPQYVALGRYISRQREVITGLDHYRAIDLAFGLPSAEAVIPKSGSAAYGLTLSGTRSSSATEHLLFMMGNGTALVDFATGQLEISGKTSSWNFLGGGLPGAESIGNVRASGAIVAGENRFAGTFTAQAGASDRYSGDLTGSFYGPDADDIGGTLYGTSGEQYYSLAFAGYELPGTAPDDTLANLKGSTRFRTVMIPGDLPASAPHESSLGETIIYNADTQTYLVSSRSSLSSFSFGPADRASDKDVGDLQAYGAAQPVADGKIQYGIGLFDGESEGLQLTYTSFLRVLSTRTGVDGEIVREGIEYIGFGNFTPPDQLPRNGSATYQGRIFGDIDDGSKLFAPLSGRSDLTTNFATGSLAASLFPVRVDAGGGSTALGRYDFAGSIDAFTAAFAGTWGLGTGSLVGRFYGDVAQEYAAVFNIEDPAVGHMSGISVGKRDVP